jgi:6-phosphogluconate dehydrogenase (decarboxylating)
MQVGMIGLGRMGANMVRRLMRSGHGHHCVVDDRNPAAVDGLVKEGADQRFASRGEGNFAARLLSALRFEFGGHEKKP